MNELWNITLEDYFEVIELAKKNGKKPGDSMEDEFREVMSKKGIKPSGHTELNMDELLNEVQSKGQKALSIETDEDGKTTFKTIKGKDNETSE